MPGFANQHCGPKTCQQNHSVPKTEQAPGCLISNHCISPSQQECVERNKSDKTCIGSPQILSNEPCRRSDNRQNKDERFSPNWPPGNMKPKKSLEIKIPWLNMLRS